MTPRELVGRMLAAFRAAPTRPSGAEASYRMHQLRAALELVLEEVETLANLAGMHSAAVGRRRSVFYQAEMARAVVRVFGAWRELVALASALAPPLEPDAPEKR